jgi:hypothetical protein
MASMILQALLLATTLGSLHQRPPEDSIRHLRYDLRTGDHLVYRQTIEVEVDGRVRYGVPDPGEQPARNPTHWRARAEWTSHVMILARQQDALITAFQRTRTQVDVPHYQLHGADLPEERRRGLRDWLAPEEKATFSQASRITDRGLALVPASAVREWPSKILWALSELPPLPERPVSLGDAWTGEAGLDATYHVAASDTLDDEACLRIDGWVADHVLIGREHLLPDSVRLRYWFCPRSGLLRRFELDGSYPSGTQQKIHEKLVIELVDRRRGEHVERWLADPELRRGIVEALLASGSAVVDPVTLYALLGQEDAALQRRILALVYRQELQPPPSRVLEALSRASDPRVRTLAVRVLETVPKDTAQSLIRRALVDEDFFVRRAAMDWVRARLPATAVGELRSATDVETVWELVADTGRLWERASDDAGSPCDPAAWSRQVTENRRASRQRPGTQLRGMGTPGFRGWPYAVHVPEDYRGDKPFPLLVYLAGDAGNAIDGAALGEYAARQAGYLVVYPHASGHWYWEGQTASVDALLTEVLRTFNVDASRIYLSGLSNGGTGTYYLSALWPHRFSAAVAAMGSGRFVPVIERPFPENLANLPLLFLHGERDQTIPPEATRQTVDALKLRWAPLEAHYFPDRGHSIVIGRGDDGRTFDFLERHRERRMPSSVMFKTQSMRYPRHYWVEILEKEEGVAEVRGEISDRGEVRLDTKRIRRLRLLLRPELFRDTTNIRVVVNGRRVFAGPLLTSCALLRESYEATGDPYLAYSTELDFTVP